MKTTLLVIPCLLLSSLLYSQTGINNNNPEQVLDVGGKVKIADDNNTPTAGTIRYNSSSNDFEGHNGNAWNSFTIQPEIATGPLPNGPVPIGGAIESVSPNSVKNFTFIRLGDPNQSSFSTVPNGKKVLITYLQLEGSDETSSSVFRDILNGPAIIDAWNVLPLNGDNKVVTDPYGLLFVLNSGDGLGVINGGSSPSTINVYVRGFLVDNLDY